MEERKKVNSGDDPQVIWSLDHPCTSMVQSYVANGKIANAKIASGDSGVVH